VSSYDHRIDPPGLDDVLKRRPDRSFAKNLLMRHVAQPDGGRKHWQFLLSVLIRIRNGFARRLGRNEIHLFGNYVDEVQLRLELPGERVSIIQCRPCGLRKVRGGEYALERSAGADLVALAGNAITGHELSRTATLSDSCEVHVMHVTCHM
jgi:hypothetical protein